MSVPTTNAETPLALLCPKCGYQTLDKEEHAFCPECGIEWNHCETVQTYGIPVSTYFIILSFVILIIFIGVPVVLAGVFPYDNPTCRISRPFINIAFFGIPIWTLPLAVVSHRAWWTGPDAPERLLVFHACIDFLFRWILFILSFAVLGTLVAFVAYAIGYLLN